MIFPFNCHFFWPKSHSLFKWLWHGCYCLSIPSFLYVSSSTICCSEMERVELHMLLKMEHIMDFYSICTALFSVFFFSSIPFLIIRSIQFTFLIATEHWADIYIDLSIITPRSCFCVVITSQDHHCLCKIIFPMYITLHLSTMDFIFHFIISHSASNILQCFFQLAFIFTTLNKIITSKLCHFTVHFSFSDGEYSCPNTISFRDCTEEIYHLFLTFVSCDLTSYLATRAFSFLFSNSVISIKNMLRKLF